MVGAGSPAWTTCRFRTGYKYRGQGHCPQRRDVFRADVDVLADVEPIYETFPGWSDNIVGV